LYCYIFCLNYKGNQEWRNKLKSGGTNNLQAKRAEKKIKLWYAKLPKILV